MNSQWNMRNDKKLFKKSEILSKNFANIEKSKIFSQSFILFLKIIKK